MFVSIELDRNSSQRKYIVSDTDFVKKVNGSDLLDAFRKVYEGKVDNYPRYLMRFIMWWQSGNGNDFWTYHSRSPNYPVDDSWMDHVDKYRDELDKWLVLR